MRKLIVYSILLVLVAFGGQLLAQTKVVVLGTGTPVADPDRSGPAVAIVVKDNAYLVDAGPGVVRRAAASERNGITQLHPQDIRVVFFTHLHSDHTLGYPDLIFSPWVLDRSEPLTAYGPKGLKDMTQHIEKAWGKDIDVRLHGLEKANATGYKVNVHEISPGVVYQDANVKVTAFPVKHGSWDQSFGYRFDTGDRSIVLSGDTAPIDSVAKACDGCDVLLHEVYDPQRAEVSDPHWAAYFKAFHTTSGELADIATRARPKLLVLYHQLYGEGGDDALIEQVKKHYSGQVVSAKDLGVY